jgi:uncharacterized membrane protein YoaK (UPF0700 family)
MSPEAERDAALLVLTAVSGVVDAIAFLALGRVFTANMTGNLVLFAIALGQGMWSGALRSTVAFAGFALGAYLGGRGRRPDPDAFWPAGATRLLGFELALLVAFAAGWLLFDQRPHDAEVYLLIAPAALAMGLQSAAAARLHVAGVTTTYVTGTLAGLMTEMATGTGSREEWGRRAGALAALAAGAGAGALLVEELRWAVPWLAVLLVAGVAFEARRRFARPE